MRVLGEDWYCPWADREFVVQDPPGALFRLPFASPFQPGEGPGEIQVVAGVELEVGDRVETQPPPPLPRNVRLNQDEVGHAQFAKSAGEGESTPLNSPTPQVSVDRIVGDAAIDH